MIDLDFVVRFPYHLKYEEVNQKTVSDYLKELEETVSHIKDNSFDNHHVLFVNRKMEGTILNTLSAEIDLCKFYLELREKQSLETSFRKWVFTKKENVKTSYEWVKPKGDQWTKTNGKVKVTVEIDRSGLMTKITLSAKNDSQILKFIDSDDTNPLEKSHLKNLTAINRKIELLKTQADLFLNEHEFPKYNPTNLRHHILSKLLGVSREKVVGGG